MNIEAERMNMGLSVRQAAKKIGVSHAVLRNAELGARTHPRLAKKIADFYGVKVTDLWPIESRPKDELVA